MEITGLNMKEAESFLLDLVAEIRAGSEVHIDLSEETREVKSCWVDATYCVPTGKMTLIVSWTGDRDSQKLTIDEKRFIEIGLEVQEEMGYSGLTDTVYGEFALRVAERYIAEAVK